MFWQWKVDFVLVNYATCGYEICVALLICWTWGRLTCETVIWALHLLLFSVLNKSVSMSHTISSDTKFFLLISCDLSIWERCMEVSRTVEIQPRQEWHRWRIRLGGRNRKCIEKPPRIRESKLCSFSSGPHKMPLTDPWNTLFTGHGLEHCTNFLGS